jgi:hypothetical protein
MFEKGAVQRAIIDINSTHLGCDRRSILLLGRHVGFGFGRRVANFGNASLDNKVG